MKPQTSILPRRHFHRPSTSCSTEGGNRSSRVAGALRECEGVHFDDSEREVSHPARSLCVLHLHPTGGPLGSQQRRENSVMSALFSMLRGKDKRSKGIKKNKERYIEACAGEQKKRKGFWPFGATIKREKSKEIGKGLRGEVFGYWTGKSKRGSESRGKKVKGWNK
jgi:hypothetical protein